MQKFILTYFNDGADNLHSFEAYTYGAATELAKAWMFQYFPTTLHRGEWSLDRAE